MGDHPVTPTSYGLEQAANETTPRWRERDLGMWVQSYAPFLDSIGLSASVALIPIVLVFVLLGVFKRPAHQATLAGLTAALVLAGAVWAMPPRLLMSAMLLGVAVALIPLLWTLVGAVWFINLLVHSGHFDIIRKSLTALTPDRRLQTILIGFGFLGLLEGLVAIGSPVAIGTAMLVGFGFPPITASVVALIGFSHPGVWGPMGLPIVVLQSVTTGIDLDAIGVMVGRQVPLLTLLCAPIMVVVVAGWRGLRGVWPITIATGLAFAIGTFTMSNYGTLYLAGSAGALAAILTTVVCLSIWKPKSAWRFPGEPDVDDTGSDGPALGSIIRAWAPVGLLVVIMGGISGTPAREALTSLSTLSLTWPGLHDLVMRTPPVVPTSTPYGAVYSQSLLVVPGTLVMLTGILSLPLLRISPWKATVIYGRTVRQLWSAIRTTVSIIALGYVMNYAGLSFTIGVALAVSGFWFPAIAVLLGLLGNAVAGTNTASNALFGNLVAVAGEQTGAPPVFAVSSLAAGGSMGKAIAPQSLALATGAASISGREGDLLRRVLPITLVLTVGFAIYAMVLYHLLPWMISGG